MQFGMPTLIENHTLEENAALCESLGLSFVELNMNFPEYQVDRLEQTITTTASRPMATPSAVNFALRALMPSTMAPMAASIMIMPITNKNIVYTPFLSLDKGSPIISLSH